MNNEGSSPFRDEPAIASAADSGRGNNAGSAAKPVRRGLTFFHKFLEAFGFYNHSRFMESSMTEDNIHAMRLISILAIFAAVLFLRVSYTNHGYALPVYRCTNYVAVFVSAGVLVLLQILRKKIALSFHRFHACMFVYILWLSYCGFIASMADSRNHGGFIAFLISQVWAYDLILIPPFVSVIFCGATFVAFTTAISHVMYFPTAKYMECAVFYVTIIAVNYFHYRSAIIKINREEVMLNDNVRLDKLSTTDELTEVRNRTGLRVDFERRFCDSLYVLMCDIDNFKQYNDAYGHQTGDKVLSEFALVLSEEFGRANVYRYGGDEFLVLIVMQEEKDFLEKLQSTVWAYGNIAFGNDIHPTSSFGYVHGACHTPDELRAMIKAADAELYAAKKAGRNQIRGDVFAA